jgi:hypothetical protein
MTRSGRTIWRFLSRLIGPQFRGPDLEALCRRRSHDEEREAEALEWAEATIGDVGNIGDVGDQGR